MESSLHDGLGLRYLRVANSLRKMVIDGAYQAGERLPRQHDLAKEHNVSFSTLKQALDLLEEEGYLVRKVGQGTYASLPEQHAPVALVVDDDESTCEYLSRALGRSGWRSVAVPSGEEALRRLGEQRFDLVFLDLVMPGMSGPEVFREIHDSDPELLAVIMTAYADSDLMAQALQVGPFALMKKPFSLAEIRNLLANVRGRAEPSGGRRTSIAQRQVGVT